MGKPADGLATVRRFDLLPAHQGAPSGLQQAFQASHLEVPDDLNVADNGLIFTKDRAELDALWFEVIEREGGVTYHEFRAVRLLHLVGIPYNVRQDQGALAKMRTILRGLYNAKVDIAYIVAGIYHPDRLSIVQCYGAVGRARTLDEAISRAMNSAASLEAALTAAYPQTRLAPLDAETAETLTELSVSSHGSYWLKLIILALVLAGVVTFSILSRIVLVETPRSLSLRKMVRTFSILSRIVLVETPARPS